MSTITDHFGQEGSAGARSSIFHSSARMSVSEASNRSAVTGAGSRNNNASSRLSASADSNPAAHPAGPTDEALRVLCVFEEQEYISVAHFDEVTSTVTMETFCCFGRESMGNAAVLRVSFNCL